MLNRKKQAVDDAWQQYCHDALVLHQTQTNWRAACPRHLQPLVPLVVPFLAGLLLPVITAQYRQAATLSGALLNTTKLLNKVMPLLDRIQKRQP